MMKIRLNKSRKSWIWDQYLSADGCNRPVPWVVWGRPGPQGQDGCNRPVVVVVGGGPQPPPHHHHQLFPPPKTSPFYSLEHWNPGLLFERHIARLVRAKAVVVQKNEGAIQPIIFLLPGFTTRPVLMPPVDHNTLTVNHKSFIFVRKTKIQKHFFWMGDAKTVHHLLFLANTTSRHTYFV